MPVPAQLPPGKDAEMNGPPAGISVPGTSATFPESVGNSREAFRFSRAGYFFFSFCANAAIVACGHVVLLCFWHVTGGHVTLRYKSHDLKNWGSRFLNCWGKNGHTYI